MHQEKTLTFALFLLFLSISICEPIKIAHYLFAVGILIVFYTCKKNKCTVWHITIPMMLLPICTSRFDLGTTFDMIIKYELYLLTYAIISKIKIFPTATVNACMATSSIHVLSTLAFWLMPMLYFAFWFLWGVNVYEKFPIGTENGINGYTAGLTSHYSANALYVTVTLLSIASVFFSNSGTRKSFFCILLLLSCTALLLTTKRAHLIFSFFAVFFVLLYENKKKTMLYFVRIIFALPVIFIIGYLAFTYFPEVFNVFSRFKDIEDGSGRTLLWSKALEFWSENPVFGIGWMGFQDMYSKFDYITYNTHNVFLQLLCETGIVGLTIFLIFIISNTKKLLKLLNRQKHLSCREKEILRFSAFIQVFFLMYCFTGNCIYDNTMFYYSVAAGISVSLYNNKKQKQ